MSDTKPNVIYLVKSDTSASCFYYFGNARKRMIQIGNSKGFNEDSLIFDEDDGIIYMRDGSQDEQNDPIAVAYEYYIEDFSE